MQMPEANATELHTPTLQAVFDVIDCMRKLCPEKDYAALMLSLTKQYIEVFRDTNYHAVDNGQRYIRNNTEGGK